jgi:hypothetical protein
MRVACKAKPFDIRQRLARSFALSRYSDTRQRGAAATILCKRNNQNNRADQYQRYHCEEQDGAPDHISLVDLRMYLHFQSRISRSQGGPIC